MAKEFDYLAEARAAGERIADPLHRARILFKSISGELGVPSAKLIFELCAQEAVEPSAAADKEPRQDKMKLPTIAQADNASHAKICTWWERLRHTNQKFSSVEKKVIGRIFARYVGFGGYPEGYVEGKLPPIKKQGARQRNAPKAAELPAMFSALKAERPGRRNWQCAEIIAKQKNGAAYGKSVEAIERAEREWRKKNRKV